MQNFNNIDTLHCFIEIVDGIFEKNKSLYVEYKIVYKSDWKLITKKKDENFSNEIIGFTKKCRSDKSKLTFNHLFELNLKNCKTKEKIENVKNDFKIEKKFELIENWEINWPRLELYVWNVDNLKRKNLIGFSFLSLPQKPGHHNEKINIWSPLTNNPFDKLKEFFLGYSLEPKENLLETNDWRILTNSQVVGSISIKINLVFCKFFQNQPEKFDEIEEKIQKVVIAFRNARKKMHHILNDKKILN